VSGAEEQVVYQQLSFKLQELSPQGRQWDLEIPEGLFGDAGFGEVDAPASLCKGVQWKGNVIAQDNLFSLQGQWSTELTRHCVRCNSEFALCMEGDCSRHFRRMIPLSVTLLHHRDRLICWTCCAKSSGWHGSPW